MSVEITAGHGGFAKVNATHPLVAGAVRGYFGSLRAVSA